MSISGIKSVDFFLTAVGEGVVNHNGAFSAWNPAAGKVLDNHMFPKMRGLDPMQRLSKDGASATSMSIRLDDEAIGKARLIVSAECIRAQLFRDVSFGLAKVTVDNVGDVIASLHGLVRGYLITEGGRNFARKSCLYVTDFECEKPELSYNQGTNSKVRGTADEKTSIYSYFKTGKDLKYVAKASLSVEELQFIALENSLGRSSYDHQITVATGNEVAAGITQFLKDIAGPGLTPEAVFCKKAVRIGSVSKVGDAGVVLNADAQRVVIAQVIEMFKGLCIRQGKGYVQMTEVIVDFNDSTNVFRSGSNPAIANGSDAGEFATYYRQESMTDVEYEAHMKTMKLKDEVKKGIKQKATDEKAAKKDKATAAEVPAA